MSSNYSALFIHVDPYLAIFGLSRAARVFAALYPPGSACQCNATLSPKPTGCIGFLKPCISLSLIFATLPRSHSSPSPPASKSTSGRAERKQQSTRKAGRKQLAPLLTHVQNVGLQASASLDWSTSYQAGPSRYVNILCTCSASDFSCLSVQGRLLQMKKTVQT